MRERGSRIREDSLVVEEVKVDGASESEGVEEEGVFEA